ITKATATELNLTATGNTSYSVVRCVTDEGNGKYMIGYGSAHGSQPSHLSIKNAYGPISFFSGGTAYPANAVMEVVSTGIEVTGNITLSDPAPVLLFDDDNNNNWSLYTNVNGLEVKDVANGSVCATFRNGGGFTVNDIDNGVIFGASKWTLDASGNMYTAGNITLAGTVDGRDLATDGSKLDAIEALADVTDATNVAAATALMDADFSSNGIMSRTGAGIYAIITDNSSNWNTAYGWGDHGGAYLPIGGGTLTGDLTILSSSDQILTLQQSGTGGAGGTPEAGWNYIGFVDGDGDRQGYFGIDTTGNFLFAPEITGGKVKINGPNGLYVLGAITTDGTVDGRDLATDGSKLDNIEASADVTDVTNVTAAGALMDSEVDADIKTLTLPASTTISTFGASLIDDAAAVNARSTLGLGSVEDTALSTWGGSTNIVTVGNIITGQTLHTGYLIVDEDEFLVSDNGVIKRVPFQSFKTYFDGQYLIDGIDTVNTHNIDWGLAAEQVDADSIPDGATNVIITSTQETNFESAYSHISLTNNPHAIVWSDVSSGHDAGEHDGVNIISAQTTALTSAPAATDEFLISDAGTIKRMDYSVLLADIHKNTTLPDLFDTTIASLGTDQVLTYDNGDSKWKNTGPSMHIAATSMRLDSGNTTSYYYGNSSYGWNYTMWATGSAGDPDDRYSHCGMICPVAFKHLVIKGTIASVTNASKTVNMKVMKAARQAGGGAMSYSQIGSDVIIECTTADIHYDIEFAEDVTLTKGELIFVMFNCEDWVTGKESYSVSFTVMGKGHTF
ncbi:hypothetical protein HN747_05090, partial [archaeon]|nr:hypothetical protein [archaeon]